MSEEAQKARQALQESMDLREQGHSDDWPGARGHAHRDERPRARAGAVRHARRRYQIARLDL